jgi:hypothetical protein
MDDFNRVAAANLPGLHHAAENSATPAQRFPKSLPDRIHLMAWLAFLGDFQERSAHANPLAHQQSFELDPASRDIFFHPAGIDSEFLERLNIHQQQLPAAAGPPVDALLESFVCNSERLVEFADRLAVRQRLKQVQNFSHGEVLRQRAIW